MKLSELKIIVKEELNSIIEKSPEGWEGTVKAMKDKPGIDNPWALAHWMKNKGWKSRKEAVIEAYLTENPAAMAAAAMATVRLKNQQGRTIKGTSALKSKNPTVKKKAVGMFQRLKDKFAKKKDDKKAAPKKQSKSDVDFYKKQYADESVNERSDFRAMKDFMTLAGKRKIDYISRYDDSQLQVDIGKKSFLIQVQSLKESVKEVRIDEASIKDIGQIVKKRQAKKLDGVLVDMQTANVIMKVHKALSASNRKKFEKLPIKKMAGIAWKLAR